MLEHETNSDEWIEKLFEDRHGQNWGSAARGKDHFVAFLWITKNCSTFFRKVTNDVRVDCANFNNVVVVALYFKASITLNNHSSTGIPFGSHHTLPMSGTFLMAFDVILVAQAINKFVPTLL